MLYLVYFTNASTFNVNRHASLIVQVTAFIFVYLVEAAWSKHWLYLNLKGWVLEYLYLPCDRLGSQKCWKFILKSVHFPATWMKVDSKSWETNHCCLVVRNGEIVPRLMWWLRSGVGPRGWVNASPQVSLSVITDWRRPTDFLEYPKRKRAKLQAKLTVRYMQKYSAPAPH